MKDVAANTGRLSPTNIRRYRVITPFEKKRAELLYDECDPRIGNE
jgi:hypothetical protein